MYSNKLSVYVSLFIMVTLINTGCVGGNVLAPGDVVALGAGQAANIIKSALTPAVQTDVPLIFVLKDAPEKIYMFSRALPSAGGWGFVCTPGDCTKAIALIERYGANLTGSESFGEMVTYITQHGWKAIPASEVDPVVKEGLLSQIASWTAATASAVNNMKGFILMVPAGFFGGGTQFMGPQS